MSVLNAAGGDEGRTKMGTAKVYVANHCDCDHCKQGGSWQRCTKVLSVIAVYEGEAINGTLDSAPTWMVEKVAALHPGMMLLYWQANGLPSGYVLPQTAEEQAQREAAALAFMAEAAC